MKFIIKFILLSNFENDFSKNRLGSFSWWKKSEKFFSKIFEVLYGEKKAQEESTIKVEKAVKELMKDFRERENKYLKSTE